MPPQPLQSPPAMAAGPPPMLPIPPTPFPEFPNPFDPFPVFRTSWCAAPPFIPPPVPGAHEHGSGHGPLSLWSYGNGPWHRPRYAAAAVTSSVVSEGLFKGTTSLTITHPLASL